MRKMKKVTKYWNQKLSEEELESLIKQGLNATQIARRKEMNNVWCWHRVKRALHKNPELKKYYKPGCGGEKEWRKLVPVRKNVSTRVVYIPSHFIEEAGFDTRVELVGK